MKRGEVETRRERFVQIEEETIRERDRIRKNGQEDKFPKSGLGGGVRSKKESKENAIAASKADVEGRATEPLDVLTPMPVES